MEYGFSTGLDLHQTFLQMLPIVSYHDLRETSGRVDISFREDYQTGEITVADVQGPVTGLVVVSLNFLEADTRGVELKVWEGRLLIPPVVLKIVGYDPGVCVLCCTWANFKELGYGCDR